MRTRAALQSRQGFNVPSLIARELRATRLDVAGEKENVDIDAIEQLFRTQRYSGRALWSGRTSAGLLGEFPRWLSDDDAEIGRNQCSAGRSVWMTRSNGP